MTTQHKARMGALTDNPLAASVKESAEQVWLAGLGAYGLAQEEGSRLFTALIKEGEVVQARTLKIADAKLTSVTNTAARTFDRLEKALEDGVARSLASLGVPSKRDINRLSTNVAALTAVVQEWSEEHAQ